MIFLEMLAAVLAGLFINDLIILLGTKTGRAAGRAIKNRTDN
jgi:uncharacterized membrane protein YqgA involved in biofilm formation